MRASATLLAAAIVMGLSACATVAPQPDMEKSITLRGIEIVLPTSAVPHHVLDAVAEVAVAAAEPRVIITSGSRTPRKQVEVMIDYYLECADNPKCGVDYFLETYEPECLGNMLGVYRPIADLPAGEREEVLAAMTVEVAGAINVLDTAAEKGGPPRGCMGHVSAPGKYAVDVDPEFITRQAAFYREVKNLGERIVQERFYYPDIAGVPKSPAPDAAFHIEVREPS